MKLHRTAYILIILCILHTTAFTLSAKLGGGVLITTEEQPPNASEASQQDMTEESQDILRFKNGDRLHGDFVNATADSGIVWQTKEVAESILFRLDNLASITFKHTNRTSPLTPGTEVVLTNGDTLNGKIISLDAKTMKLKTTFAGTLLIDRHMISSIQPKMDNSGIYYGPNSISEWAIKSFRNTKGKVTVQDGVMNISPGISVARDVRIPDKVEIAFDILPLRNFQLLVQLGGKESERYPSKGYVLYISPSYIYMQKLDDTGASNMGNVRLKGNENKVIRLQIFMNKQEKLITLLINGKRVKQWTDTDWAAVGGFLTFYNQSSNIIQIKNISASKWNGQIPTQEGNSVAEKQDVIKLINNDTVSGEIKAITNGQVEIQTKYSPLKIPLKRVRKILTSKESRHRARRRAGDIECVFGNGHYITLKFSEIKNGIITGETDNFGKVEMRLDKFSRIKFNIYDN